jgi:hypothetical protein
LLAKNELRKPGGHNMCWHAFSDGTTIGTRGSENGIVVLDEEHEAGARITLEEDCKHAPWSITCGVYWLMFHTRFFGDRLTAEAEYASMKSALDAIMSQLDPADFAGLARSAGDFVDRFP